MNTKQKYQVYIALILLAVGAFIWFNRSEPSVPTQRLGAYDLTTFENPITFLDDIIASDAATFATTTVARSFDGFMAGGGIAPASVSTSTLVHTLYTHTGGPALCDSSASALIADATGVFAPSIVISVGTSTSATFSKNLVASSTAATSTDTYSGGTNGSIFRLNAGDKITAGIGDIANNEASSTNFANWDIEYQTQCWLING